jgi:hypothetical protein
MRNNYKNLYGGIQIPPVQRIVAYADVIRANDERRVSAAQIAKQQAKLRREKLAERWVVFTVSLVMAIAMLPVLVVIGAILLIRALWQRFARGQKQQQIALTTSIEHEVDEVQRETSAEVSPRTAYWRAPLSVASSGLFLWHPC